MAKEKQPFEPELPVLSERTRAEMEEGRRQAEINTTAMAAAVKARAEEAAQKEATKK